MFRIKTQSTRNFLRRATCLESKHSPPEISSEKLESLNLVELAHAKEVNMVNSYHLNPVRSEPL